MKFFTVINKFHFPFCAGLVWLLCCFFQSTYAQQQKTNLPTIYIYTDNNVAVTNKTDYIPGRIIIKSSDPTEELNVVTTIRGRGNSTWDFPKKPYRIKLDKKQNLLNLPAKARSWTLLANYADKTLMRNAVAFKISELTGMEFSPSARFVDLVLNDSFLGSYMVSDQMQVHENRVNIDELLKADIDADVITGGYLLEIDGFATSEPIWFSTPKGLKITVKSPDDTEINQQQLDYIKNYIKDFENILFSSSFKNPVTGYRPLVDTASLVNWYIACELTGNPDSFWSTYIYKKRGDDRLFFGPLWDYDIAFNNDSRLGDATRKLMREYAHHPRTWIERIYEDEWFQQAVWRRWNELLSENLLENLTAYIDETALLLDESQRLNFTSWPNLGTKVYLEYHLFRTYGEGIAYLKKYLSDRISFLTGSFEYIEPPKPSEAFVSDDTYYYMIMNKKTNNVIDVLSESTTENATLVSWEPSEEDNAQLWSFVPAKDNTYRIVNKNSGMAMTGCGHGNTLQQRNVNEQDDAQRWKIIPVNTGNVYGIVNAKTNYSINNSGGGTNNGNPVIEYTSKIIQNGSYYTVDSENQQWYLKKAASQIIISNIVNPDIRNIVVYPNPASGQIYINITLQERNDITLNLYNLLGEQVYHEYFRNQNPGECILNASVSGFDPGVYLMTLMINSERTTKKIIIQ